jgi:hypothetical protein
VKADPANAGVLQALASIGQNNPDGAAALGDKLSTDSSFLNTIDERLARPFLMGFADSAVNVFFWAALIVLVAFAMSFFIKAAPLRDKSAAQEAAEAAAASGH